MMKIGDSAAYTLYKKKNSFSYTLQLKEPNVLFMTLLTNLVPNAFYNDNEYDNENENENDVNHSIIFTANTVTPLTANAVKNNVNQMIRCLSKQLEYFHDNNLAFYGFDLDDIIVINDTIFLIVNNKYSKTLDKERTITFYGPFSKPYFSSPELINLKCLPAKIDYQTSYYSLGALIVYYLFDINSTIFIGLKRESLDDKVFESILNTKLYWFLKRCLNDNPKKRILLYL
jgi:hypothetical protein